MRACSFHSDLIKKGYKIFINPKFIICPPPREHIRDTKRLKIKNIAQYLFPGIIRFYDKKIKRVKES